MVDVSGLRRCPPARSKLGGMAACALALPILSACAGAPPPVVEVAPPLDVEQEALRSETATRLEGPIRVVFDWTAREVGGGRFQGQGVARVEPPDRARLDLFLDNGEAVARAALVGDEMRLPPGMPGDLLPPSHLLWGALGVFRPGVEQTLLGGETVEGLVRVRYRLEDGSEIHYYLADRRIERVERLRGGDVVQRVEVELDGQAVPVSALYRDLASGQELRITRTSVENVEPYPPDIWLR